MGKERLRLRILGATIALATLGLTGIAPGQCDPGDADGDGLPQCNPGDANGDGLVNDDDLSRCLSCWMDCPECEFSGVPPVNDDDLSILLGHWTGPIYVAHARPQQTTDFVKAATVEIEGESYHVWEMRVTTQFDWTNTRLDFALTEGSMYQHPRGREFPPSEALVAAFPELVYDTYVQAATGEWAGTAGDVVMTETAIGISWFDSMDTGPGSFKIGQVTLSADAAGRATGKSYEVATAGVGVPFAFTIIDGTSPLLGDVDLSGCVDDDDLSLLLAHWGDIWDPWGNNGEFGPMPIVDDDALSLLLANWTGPCQTIDLVPEPATLELLAVGAVVMFRQRKQRTER